MDKKQLWQAYDRKSAWVPYWKRKNEERQRETDRIEIREDGEEEMDERGGKKRRDTEKERVTR